MRTWATLVLAALTLTCTAATARADGDGPARDGEGGHRPSHLMQVGFIDLEMPVAGFDTDVSALMFAAGWQRGDHAVYGEVAGGVHHGKLDGTSVQGFAGSASVHVRGALAALGITDGADWIRLGCWLDAGVGYQVFTWQGDHAARPVLSLGVGGGWRFGRRARSIGFSAELRLVAAPGARWFGPAVRCTGACEPAAPAGSRVDAGATLLFAFPFSR
jgi:hypothetical protein